MTEPNYVFSNKALDALIRDLRADLHPVGDIDKAGHPDDDDLFGYGVGTLSETNSVLIRQHLDGCTQCASRVEAFQTAAKAWEGPDADEQLDALMSGLRVAISTPRQLTLLSQSTTSSPHSSEPPRSVRLTVQQEQPVYAILRKSGAIERNYDYALPCGLHTDTHINIGKICRSAQALAGLVSAMDSALHGIAFDTVVSTSWAVATIARRLVMRRCGGRPERIRHILAEGYDPPTLMEDIAPGANVLILLDVLVTGGLVGRIADELQHQKANSVRAISIVDAGLNRGRPFIPIESLCHVPMDLARPKCRRCGILPPAHFNPIAGRMTTRKERPRSPSEFLIEDSTAREFWEFVDTAGAYEHHRVIGRRHYVGFIDTARLLRHGATGPRIVKKLCERIAKRSGPPDVLVVPARAKSLLLGKRLIDGFREFLGWSEVRLWPVRQRAGYFRLSGSVDGLAGRRVLVADVAAGHGQTLDELGLLASQAGAAAIGGTVLLSRLSEGCEEALDERFSSGFTRLYSMPVRPITVHDKTRGRCPVCQRRQSLREAVTELPAGPIRDLANQLASTPRFRRRIERSAGSTVTAGRQIALFPLARCRRGVASGVALHALHAAMGDGMAPLSLPEVADAGIPPTNRAALVADLPPGALAWSGQPLVNDLCAYLRGGGDRDVWMAIIELMSRSETTVWIDCLNEAIANVASHGRWMDDRFWAWMMWIVHRLVRATPELSDQLRPRLESLVQAYSGTSAHRGLQGMLSAVLAAKKPVALV
jgi:orotate phosphoribosyltransferase